MQQEQEFRRLWAVRKTIFEMLKDRAYTVLEEVHETLAQFREAFGQEDPISVRDHLDVIGDRKGQALAVFFCHGKNGKLGIAHIKDLFTKLKVRGAHKMLLVVPLGLTPQTKKFIKELPPPYRIECFVEEELIFNITKNVRVPKHQVLLPRQKRALLQKYRVEAKQLPSLLPTDPVARYYGLQRGQVVSITRPSKTAGTYVTYRHVV